MSGGLSVLTQHMRCYQCQLNLLYELGARSGLQRLSGKRQGGGETGKELRTSRERDIPVGALWGPLSIAVGQTAKQGLVHGGKVVGSRSAASLG